MGLFSKCVSGISENKFFLLFLAIAFWNFPISTFYPDSGLDPSWVIGVNLAFLNNIQVGTDLMWGYGLLGFLLHPLVLNYNLWRFSFVFATFAYFLFIIALYLLLINISAKWYHYILFIPILFFIKPIETSTWMILISSSMFLYLILLQKVQSKTMFFYLIIVGFLLAIDSLIKFDMFWNALYLILGFCTITFILKHDTRQVETLVGSFAVSFFAIWFITQQHLTNFIAYLIGGFETTLGYTEAMAIPGPFWHVYIGFAALVLLLMVGIYFLIRKNKDGIIFLILNMFILFSAFKSGFVRHDPHGHILEFICVFTVYFGILLILIMNFPNNYDKKVFYALIILITICMGLFFTTTYIAAPWVLTNNVVTQMSVHESTLQLLSNQTYFVMLVDQRKEKIIGDYPVNATMIKSIDNSTIDIFPWDIALCWAYDLNWSPRPIFQSYSAYTPYLDTLNSQHFSDPTNSPDKILYAYGSIDGRYPLFDEPKTFRTIINHYTYSGKSGEFILLNRSLGQIENNEVYLGSTTAKMGDPIIIPSYSGEIFGNVTIKYSLQGNLLKTVYKPAPLYIRFQLKNGFNSPKYRLIPDNAQDGLYLSQYVSDTDTLAWIFQGNQINDVDSIIIETDQPWEYSKDVEITFTGKPHLTMNMDNSLLNWKIIPMRTFPEQRSVTYNFKSINDQVEPALFEHPMTGGSEMIINNISIPEKAYLNFEISLDPQVWSPDKGDGVGYQIYVNTMVPENLIFSQYIDPKHNATEQRWNPYQLDLSPYAGENVTLIFSTNPGPINDGTYDWAWWGNPRIQNI
jgi:hypothetical protein